MNDATYSKTEYFKKELKEVLTTEDKPIPYIDNSYFIKLDNNGKEVTYFNDKNQRGCFSVFEKTDEGTRYQILWHDNNEDVDEFYYKITEPTDMEMDEFYKWEQLRIINGKTGYLTSETLSFLEENKDKCAEIIDTAKRLRADIFGYTPEDREEIYKDKHLIQEMDTAYYNGEIWDMIKDDELEENKNKVK